MTGAAGAALEVVTTRRNPLVDPTLHVWGWEIPVYLFLGGFVAGIMVLSGYLLYSGRAARRPCVCFTMPLVALALLSVGMFALFLDLEHKLYTWRLYVAFEPTSPMSWGAWILLLVYPVLVALALARPQGVASETEPTDVPQPPPSQAVAGSQGVAGSRALASSQALVGSQAPAGASRLLQSLLLVQSGGFAGGLARRLGQVAEAASRTLSRPDVVRRLGVVSMATGAALGIYTGILLSSLGARPFWSSAILGPLFLASGLSSGAAFAHMTARDPEERIALARADNGFLVAELLLVGLFLLGLANGGEAQRAAAALVLGGPFTAVFWVLVVALGILLPLVLQSLAASHRIRHTAVAPLLVLAGGLALRFVFVYAGQASHWPGV